MAMSESLSSSAWLMVLSLGSAVVTLLAIESRLFRETDGGSSTQDDSVHFVRQVAKEGVDSAFDLLRGIAPDAQPQHGRLLHAVNPAAFAAMFLSITKRDPSLAANFCSGWGLRATEIRELLKKLTDEEQKAFLRAYCPKLRTSSPLEAAELASEIPIGSFPKDIVPGVCANLLRAGPAEARRWLADLSPEQRAKILDDAYIDVQEILETSSSLPARAWMELRLDQPYPKGGLYGAFIRLAHEPKEAVSAIANKLRGQDQINAVGMIGLWQTLEMKDRFFSEPEATWLQIQSLPEEERQRLTPSMLFSDYANKDPKNAWKLAQTTSNPAIEDAVVDAVARLTSQLTVNERRKIVLEYIGTHNQKGAIQTVSTFMETLGNASPSEGIGVLAALPPGPIQDAAMSSLARAWSENDAPGAADWIAQVPPGHLRDLAIRELTSNSVDDPEIALSNVARIGDANVRREAAAEVFKAWRSLDPKWVADLARKAGFSDQEIATLGAIPPAISAQ